MTGNTTILDGKQLAQQILERTAERVAAIVEQTGKTPCLATVLVGEDPASVTYTNMKRKRCEAVGMTSRKIELPENTSTQQLIEAIQALGNDPAVHGILLQHPVPGHIDERAAFEAIPPAKDVDGVTFHSFATTSFDLPGFGSCTPAGIMTLLRHYEVPIKGSHAVVIGRSAILGKPMAMMLLAAHATVTICHSRTQDLADVVRLGDIVVAAVGKPRFVKGDWLKSGAVVIDAGYTQGNIGDVDFDAAVERASMITPVPGGVGVVTTALLLSNTVECARRQAESDV